MVGMVICSFAASSWLELYSKLAARRHRAVADVQLVGGVGGLAGEADLQGLAGRSTTTL